MEFNLGEELRDVVTGFKGVAVARIAYINGCVQYALQGASKDGSEIKPAEYFDFQRLESTGAPAVVMPSREGGAVTMRDKPPANRRP